VKIVYEWLADLVEVGPDPDRVANEIALRGFEVAEVAHGRRPVIDFEITANRPDCLSHVGLAREASVVWDRPLRLPGAAAPAAGPAERLEVEILDADLCPRYCAQVFEVTVGASPAWLADRLEAAGIRPINSVVDVSNYVMLEMGHPTHAFDLARLAGRALRIRRARPGERIRTLDKREHTLDGEMLVIADADRPQAIGGVMGGADSEVSPATRLVAMESAWFHPPSVRRTSKKLELKTEASVRFERGADISAPPAALARVAALLAEIGAGRPLGGVIDRYPSPRQPLRLTLRRPQIARLLGIDVPAADVQRILAGLGFTLSAVRSSRGEEGWLVTVPSWRIDATREADLIEEVARHYGYDRLPAMFPPLEAVSPSPDPRIARDALVRQALGGAGFAEAVTFTFIERAAAAPFDPGSETSSPSTALGASAAKGDSSGLVAITNPLSETFAVMRPSLLPGLIDAAAHNRRRGRRDVRLFEIGAAFSAADGEMRRVGLVWTGAGAPEHWSGTGRDVDFFDARGAIERAADALGVAVSIEPATVGWLVPGRAASIALAAAGPEPGLRIGIVGQLLPPIAAARGVPGGDAVYVAEIDLDRMVAASPARDDLRAAPPPRYPAIVRDLSILVPDTLPAAAVRGTIRAAAPQLLESIAEFDRYQGEGVPDRHVSVSFHLTFRAADRTLTDEEADRAMAAIVSSLEREHGARRR